MAPLEGITVVALEQAVAAPFASRQLADLGARVIKIERRGTGDFARAYDGTVNGLASHFVWLNRSKESLSLDLKNADGQKILEQLLDRADVFVHNLAPGAVDRLGLGVATLRDRFPRLIVCVISGYGTSGPYASRRAYDLLIQSETGLLAITGTHDTPCKVGISIADIAAGMYAYSGILTSLIVRQQTGRGSAIEVSLLEALGEWMGYPICYARYGGSAPPRTASSHAAIAPYGPFRCADDKTIFVGIQNDREWVRFCQQVLEQPDLATDPRFSSNSRRVAQRHALDAIICECFRQHTAEALMQRLDDAHIANSRMNTVEEFLAHPQLLARNRWRQVHSSAGPVEVLLPPVTIDGVSTVMGAIPDVGQHTDSILQELGYNAAAIDRLRHALVI
jgi:crotonobetainyl-CoA:carnitine CoA-transferase CaiB-like acyl-CoA transferase